LGGGGKAAHLPLEGLDLAVERDGLVGPVRALERERLPLLRVDLRAERRRVARRQHLARWHVLSPLRAEQQPGDDEGVDLVVHAAQPHLAHEGAAARERSAPGVGRRRRMGGEDGEARREREEGDRGVQAP